MPCDYSKYPADWHEISERIRFERAATDDAPKGRCECAGQCGHYHPDGRCKAVNYEPHPRTGSKVVLTVAHWPDPTKDNVADDNLHALCQSCHLSLDNAHHQRNRKYGRDHNGKHQTRLFDQQPA